MGEDGLVDYRLTGVKIRNAKIHDFDKGLRECFASLGQVGTPVQVEMAFKSRSTERNHTFVACKGDQIVGTITILINPKFTHGGLSMGQIEDVATHPKYRGRGVATKLLDFAIEYCRLRSCYKVILNCKPDLVEFYTNFRFEEAEVQMRLDMEKIDNGLSRKR